MEATKSLEESIRSADKNHLRRLYDWMLSWADSPYAIVALFAFAFAEASFFPIPPDVLLMAMCLGRPSKSFYFAGACTLSSVLGGAFGYALGYGLWSVLEGPFFAYVPGFSPEVFSKVRESYHLYGVWIVFGAGFSPIPFKLFTICSGVMELNFVAFLVAATVGRAGRFFLVGALIRFFGASIKGFIDRYFNILALVFTLLIFLGFGVVRWLF
jgi:membrane protein YqaA with SNARE-associated domain